MNNFNWEVLVGAVGIILLVILGWCGLKSDFGELRGELSGMRSELSGEMGGMHSEVGDMREDIRIIKSLLIGPGTEAIQSAGDVEAPGDAAETDADADEVAPGGDVSSRSGDAVESAHAAGG